MADKDNTSSPKKTPKPKDKETKPKKTAEKKTRKEIKSSSGTTSKPKKETATAKPVEPSEANNNEGTQQKKPPKRNAKGQFVKGSEKIASSGRKPGTKNKYGNIRDRLKEFILPYLDNDPDAPGNTFAKDLMRLDPDQRVDAVAKYLPFVVPKFSSTTISADSERPIAEEDRLLELDGKYKKQTEITLKSLTIVDNDNGGTETPLTDTDITNLDKDDDEEDE